MLSVFVQLKTFPCPSMAVSSYNVATRDGAHVTTTPSPSHTCFTLTSDGTHGTKSTQNIFLGVVF